MTNVARWNKKAWRHSLSCLVVSWLISPSNELKEAVVGRHWQFLTTIILVRPRRWWIPWLPVSINTSVWKRRRTSTVLQVPFVKNTMYFVAMVMKVLSEDAEFYADHAIMWFLWVCWSLGLLFWISWCLLFIISIYKKQCSGEKVKIYF